MKSIDQFLYRVPTEEYRCFEFVREIWKYLTGIDIGNRLDCISKQGINSFKELKFPDRLCMAILQRKRCLPHVGIVIDGELLHLRPNGAIIEPIKIAKGFYTSIRYFVPYE